MAWLQVRDVSFSYGGAPLLESVSLSINAGERIGLVGRNGTGKSTLMKLLLGELHPDAGSVDLTPGIKIARLAQEVPSGGDHTVFDEVLTGFSDREQEIVGIHRLMLQQEVQPAEHLAAEIERLQHRGDVETGWKLHQQAEDAVQRLGLDADAMFDSLSSGMKRRVLLARALVTQPDVLLLDEPTNHLDLESIRWLEDFLLREGLTFIFITHDRAFLQRLANRIVEIDRARLFDWTCDYQTFLERREAALEAEARQEALFDKKLAAEEIWVRTGIKARRTRNEGRVRALERMRAERSKRRIATGNIQLRIQEAQRSGHLVIAAEGITQKFGDKTVLDHVDVAVDRGDKIGIIGPNGAGKTTLIRILIGELTPGEGRVRLGSNLQIAYFDQLREQLDENASAADNVADGKDTVLINGKSRHIMGYLQDFLFAGDRARSLVRYLSGGERNRLLLARMFTRPSNLLVLDEPTNDLDSETLELLEAMIVEYPGTVLMVSHDRAFLNNVVTSTLVFEGDGAVRAYAGGYDDWLRQRQAETAPPVSSRPALARSVPRKSRKLTWKEQQELATLPARIEQLETEQAQLHARMSDPAFYQQTGAEIASATAQLEALTRELEQTFERWTDLEGTVASPTV